MRHHFAHAFTLHCIALRVIALEREDAAVISGATTNDRRASRHSTSAHSSLTTLTQHHSGSSPVMLRDSIRTTPRRGRRGRRGRDRTKSTLRANRSTGSSTGHTRRSRAIGRGSTISNPSGARRPRVTSVDTVAARILPPDFVPATANHVHPMANTFPTVRSTSRARRTRHEQSVHSLTTKSLHEAGVNGTRGTNNTKDTNDAKQATKGNSAPSPQVTDDTPRCTG